MAEINSGYGLVKKERRSEILQSGEPVGLRIAPPILRPTVGLSDPILRPNVPAGSNTNVLGPGTTARKNFQS